MLHISLCNVVNQVFRDKWVNSARVSNERTNEVSVEEIASIILYLVHMHVSHVARQQTVSLSVYSIKQQEH